MKFLRNRFISRTISVFLLLVFVQSIILPSYSYALTTGPHQPEYTSYEEPGATDMVNLLTGDFSMSLPILEVPGPEGGFSLPLTYNAGIGLDQEASWVGLGWSLNAGAVVRNINEYPDDANGEDNQITVQDFNAIKGWTSNLGLVQLGWNNRNGHYGSASLFDLVAVSWNHGVNSVGVFGVSVGDKGLGFDPVQFMGAVTTVVTWGAAGAAKQAGQTVAGAIAKQAAVEALVGVAVGAAFGSSTPSVSTNGYWKTTKKQKRKVFHKEFKIWLDKTRTEKMFGILNLGKVTYNLFPSTLVQVTGVRNGTVEYIDEFYKSSPTSNVGAASDINYITPDDQEYHETNNPVLLATDNFIVNAPQISGGITPYRLDIGTVSMPREMSSSHNRLAPIKFTDYKVPFVYDGLPANAYFYHVGNQTSVTTPSFYYGLSKSTSLRFDGTPQIYYYMNDVIFGNDDRIHTDFENNKKVPQANHIEWLTNDEIKNSATYDSKFIDFLNPSPDRNNFRSNPVSTFSSGSTIGGFVVTGADGSNYHFALPIYDYNQKTEVIDVVNPTKKSIIERAAPFANTWLLTAITGSDFIDRNSNGLADEEDWGKWIKFNYGKHADNYQWRNPYQDQSYRRDAANVTNNYSTGFNQLYYLNSIETRSHVAMFLKGDRGDGRSVNNISPLKLEEICLLSKEHYKKLVKPTAEGGYNIPNYTNKADVLCLSQTFGPASRDFLNKNVIKRILFSYTNDLCHNTLNSTAANAGKLTLTRLSVRGRNDLKIVPDYIFEYGFNPDYNEHKWDSWGIYNPNGTLSGSTHYASNSDADGSAWSLTKVITPVGSEISVNYERDAYSSVSGNPNMTVESSFSFSNKPAYEIPVNSLYVSNPTAYSQYEKVYIEGQVDYRCDGGSYYSKSFHDYFTIAAIGTDYLDFGTDFMGIGACSEFQVVSMTGTVSKINILKKGGDVRVASIVAKNEYGVENKIRYLYTAEGFSSGVISKEPSYVGGKNYYFYNYPGYPETPVMYGKVTVLNGKLSNDNDFHTKTVYDFEMPNADQYITLSTDKVPLEEIGTEYIRMREHTVRDFSAKIGSLKSIVVYDKNNIPITTTTLNYTSDLYNHGVNNYQGIFSSGLLMFDHVRNSSSDYYNQVNRTTVLTYPYVLKETVITKDGFTARTENTGWDFLTGGVLENISKSNLGVSIKTVVRPAYEYFPQMGSKAQAISNKNMLTQIGAIYTFKLNSIDNSWGLINAEAQTWRSEWNNYRIYNSSTQSFGQGAEGDAVWRKSSSYVWKGSYERLRPDGTQSFSPSDEFNFNGGAANTNWQYVGENDMFDHYGMPLESKDFSNIHTAVKVGYDGQTVIATASNAGYNEIAFSSAEDKIPGQYYFGGEVGMNAASTVVTTPVHTGNNALSVTSGGYGFVFKSSELTIGKAYRASVWSNSTNGRIYYKINDTEVLPTPQISQAVSVGGVNWYRIDLTIPKENVTSATMEVGVKSNSGTVVFDDFRFQPLAASMTCYVYPPLNFEFTAPSQSSFSWVLNNDNVFMMFEQNERGSLVKTYNESITYGVKLISESKDNYRRFHVNE